jgi:hypothetical protein
MNRIVGQEVVGQTLLVTNIASAIILAMGIIVLGRSVADALYRQQCVYVMMPILPPAIQYHAVGTGNVGYFLQWMTD